MHRNKRKQISVLSFIFIAFNQMSKYDICYQIQLLSHNSPTFVHIPQTKCSSYYETEVAILLQTDSFVFILN